MHIVYLCNEYPPFSHGGIGTFVQMMARQLVKRGHRASVLGFSWVTEFRQEDDHGVNVYRFPAKAVGKIGLVRSYLEQSRLIHRLNAQIAIDSIEGSELSFGLLPGRLPGKKIIRIHGGHNFFSATLDEPKRFSTSLIEKLSFARADHFCAVSRFAADITGRLMGIDTLHIAILPNPVDTRLFRPYSEIPERDGLMVFAGGLREKKGIRQLLQAMPRVVEGHPSAHLWIHGADTKDRRTRQSFLQLLEREMSPGISNHIAFRGAVAHDELPKINALACVLVYPSWMETQGIVVVEGMASGKAVVASQTGPGPELIENGVSGVFCDPHDPDSIADSLIQLIANPEMRASLGKNARKRAEQLFSLDVLIPRNIKFYEECLNG